MILLIAVGFIPKDGGDYLANLLVSFICALFYNTYREAGGVVYSSVMCTNNLRIASSHFYDFIFLRKGDAAHRFLKYFLLLKVQVQDMKHYQDFVFNKLGSLTSIGNTHSTFVMAEVKNTYGVQPFEGKGL